MEKNLTKRSRSLLYMFKKELENREMSLDQLMMEVFLQTMVTLKHNQFQALIHEVDYLVPYVEIDYIWEQLNQKGEGLITIDRLKALVSSISQNDDPFINRLDVQSRNILFKSMNNINILNEDEKQVLALKKFKDMLKGSNIWQMLDIFDEDKDGMLSKNDLLCILQNYGADESSIPTIIKAIFKDNIKRKIEDIMKTLGLENVKKRIDFEQMPNKNDFLKEQSLQISMNNLSMSKSLKIAKKGLSVKQIQKQEKPVKQIPKSVQPYYPGYCEMTQPFLSLAEKKLKAGQIYLDHQNPKSQKYQKWQHITKIFQQQYHLFENRDSFIERSKLRTGYGTVVDAHHINQGQLGNCYFMSAVAGVAELHPQFIVKLFVLEKNPSSIYGIRLFVDGKWETISLDARFPVDKKGKLVYGKSRRNQIWSILLQKAWAKLYSSYQSIASGSSSQGLTAVTGAPCTNITQDDANLCEIIESQLKKNFIINCAGSEWLQQKSQDWQQNQGIFAKHAYCVINLHKNLIYGNKNLTLIKLRNPWGSKSWRGSWSFTSSKWTPQLRNKLNYHKDPEDGTFYMSIQDFNVCFDRPTICHIMPKYVNSHIILNSDRQHSIMVSFVIKEKGNYFLSIYQESKRKYKSSSNYELSKSRMFVGKIVNGEVQPISSKTCSKDILHLQQILQPGEYTLSCKIKWKYKQSNNFNLASYGPAPVQFKQIPKDKEFIKKFIQAQAKKQEGKKKKYSQALGQSYKIIFASHQLGYGYIFIRNSSPYNITTQISFTKGESETGIGIKPFKPDTLQYKINIAPNNEVIKCLLVDADGMNYVMEESLSYTMKVRK